MQGIPVILVDTKKKELAGNYDNAEQQWLAPKQSKKVRGHDFPNREAPRAYRCGIYALGRNAGFVSAGTDPDTGSFAVASIRGSCRFEGRRLCPGATMIPITADGMAHKRHIARAIDKRDLQAALIILSYMAGVRSAVLRSC